MKTLVRAVALLALGGLLGLSPGPTSPYLRLLGLEQQRSLGDGALAAWLAGPDPYLAARAALAIGRTKRPQGASILLAHLHDPRIGVRAMVVYGLGLIGRPDDATAAILALGDPAGAVRVAALDAVDRYAATKRLGRNTAQAQRLVGAMLAHDVNPIVRARAAATLESFTVFDARGHAVAALEAAVRHDTVAGVRENAMWSIFRGYAKVASHRLLRASAADPDVIVRIEAVRALGSRADRSDTALLRHIEKTDASWRVQEQASESLRLLRGQELTADWITIPAFVHLPKIAPDPLANIPAMKRGPVSIKAHPPTPADVFLATKINPTTAALMNGPALGPHPRVRIVTTKGNVYLTLYPEWAPFTVANFLNLAARGYYDNNRWFRIVPDFVVQTGDPNDNGDGDAGYALGAEENPLEQQTGVISMGLNYHKKTPTPIRDSAGAQYYITLSPQLHLDRDFTVFGQVTSGFDVLAHLVEKDRVLRVERLPNTAAL